MTVHDHEDSAVAPGHLGCTVTLELNAESSELMAERETLEVDVLIVGGGPAGMSAALRLAQLQKEQGGEPLAIAVLEKAREAGAHMLSGAVLDPSALRQLVPDFKEKGAPLAVGGARRRPCLLPDAHRASFEFPITPPPLQNHGNYIISLNRFVKWLGGLVEAEGIDVFTGFPATEVLYDGDRVVGVRTGDRGIGKHGEKKSNFEPGVDIRAKVTILTDGVRGNLTKALVRSSRSTRAERRSSTRSASRSCGRSRRTGWRRARSSTRWATRCRWRSSAAASSTRCPTACSRSGSSPGSTTAIRCSIRTSRSSTSSGIRWSRRCSTGGQLVRYGAKALPEGGWHTIPRVHADGVLIAGDAGGFMNSVRLKGIHLAMRTGMLAAETAFDGRSRQTTFRPAR